MSIQQSINQGALATAALVSQNPEFQEKKKEAAYEKDIKNKLSGISKEGARKQEEIMKSLDSNQMDFEGDESQLYNQLERFKGLRRNIEDIQAVAGNVYSEAQEHYKEKGNLAEYSFSRSASEKLNEATKATSERLKGKEHQFEVMFNANKIRKEQGGISSAQYLLKEGKDFLSEKDQQRLKSILETNGTLDEAERTQYNTNSYHDLLKNKNKVNVVGDRNGK